MQEFTAEDNVELYILTKPFGTLSGNFKSEMRQWVTQHMKISADARAHLPTL